MKQESIRQLKFGREVQRHLADILQHEVEGLGQALLTITAVKCTSDLQLCRVYLTVMPAAETPLLIGLLNDEQRKIRGLLSRRIRDQVKAMPSLKFYGDDTQENVSRISEILARIKAEDAQRPTPQLESGVYREAPEAPGENAGPRPTDRR